MNTEYKILLGSTVAQLEKAVNKYLSQGWNLAGGLAVDSNGIQRYSQAIYKTTPKKAKVKPYPKLDDEVLMLRDD